MGRDNLTRHDEHGERKYLLANPNIKTPWEGTIMNWLMEDRQRDWQTHAHTDTHIHTNIHTVIYTHAYTLIYMRFIKNNN